MRRWEFVGDGSSKFWAVESEGGAVTVRYGRCGTEGRTQVKDCGTAEAAEAHVRKAIAEKERKGYREVASAQAAPAPGATGAGTTAAVAGAVADLGADRGGHGGDVLPDEDTFVVPSAWRRHVHPRRCGIRRVPAAPVKDAVRWAERQLRDQAGWVQSVLDAPGSDEQLVRAASAHRAGEPDPLGAAVLAAITPEHRSGAVRVDAWVASYGLPFAAEAVAELFEVEVHYRQHGLQRSDQSVARLPDVDTTHGAWLARGAADRVRALLAAADEETYRAAVAALAGHRKGTRPRIVVSYLVPTESQWLAETCADPAVAGRRDAVLRSMLFCSLDDPAQVAQVGGVAGLGWNGWPMSTVATVAEGIGTAVAPLVAEQLGRSQAGSDMVKHVTGVLSEIPTDEAFELLVARLDEKWAHAPVAKAARRYPVRALRLLAAATLRGGPLAAQVRHALVVHVSAHRDIAKAVLPSLPPESAAVVESLLSPRDRLPEAPSETLPLLLTSPPWARPRPQGKTRTVTGLTPPAEVSEVWLPGERQEWADTPSWLTTWGRSRDWSNDPGVLRDSIAKGSIRTASLFVTEPEDLVGPLLDDWTPTDLWDGEAVLKPVVARFGSGALGLVLRLAPSHPGQLAPLLLPFAGTEVARLVAAWAVRLKSTRSTVRAWFARHGATAARLLVPDAVGKAGPARRHAEQALRTIAEGHGPEVVRAAAEAYGAQAVAAVDELLAADPLQTSLPARMPEPVEWADPVLLPQPLVRSGDALPDAAVRHVVTMLALSRPGEPYPGLATVRELCTEDSLAAFAWAVFDQWRLAGMPNKESWALHALGLLGDDATVRRLTPLLRSWPGEGAHHRAVEGLDVLAAIGTDVALMHLHGIAQRVKFKALKVRAQEKIAEVAEGLGLTGAQLADRLVPDLGLDERGSTVVDYGSRRFTVGFDEQLRPYVLDEDGKRRKDLPQPGARDDAELAPAERKRFMALKKDVRTIAGDQVRRLESAMVESRSWPAAEFRELFVGHPLLWHLVRRLVWLSEHGGEVTAFRVAEDRTFADVEDATYTLPDDATVRLAHPLHLESRLADWAELFADYEILQPFPQLGRAVFRLGEDEGGARLTRFEGITVPTGRVLGLERRGWQRGVPQDAGVERWISRRLAADRYVVIALDDGIAAGYVDLFENQRLDTVWLDTEPGDFRGSRTYPLRFADLDPVIVCEVLADLTELTEGAAE
ncbi:WGR and DUF4132 domain-containing protein [Streptomyces sp. NPDC002004]